MIRPLKPYVIFAVRHQGDRIAKVQVRTGDGNECTTPFSVWNIAAEIEEGREVRTELGAPVRVVHHGHEVYLRSDHDDTPANNLGELPEIN